MNQIKIATGEISVLAELNESATARAIWDALPFEGKAHRWGDEVYFSIPVKCPLEESAREVMEMGELGYWPPGKAFCIFFGPTPVSSGNEIRAASSVNVIGRVRDDASVFRKVRDGDNVRVTRAQ
ncbi:MAG: cyclophilin-like fold protein [Verrucomicrobiae bacterium]|nr:cyclophilin-like fold protein [Verrucomicrobiae bacterium]